MVVDVLAVAVTVTAVVSSPDDDVVAAPVLAVSSAVDVLAATSFLTVFAVASVASSESTVDVDDVRVIEFFGRWCRTADVKAK